MTQHRESFEHLFFECDTIKKLIAELNTVIGERYDIHSDNFKLTYWYGIWNDTSGNGTAVRKFDGTRFIFWGTFRFRIWKYRVFRKVPNSKAVKSDIDQAFSTIARLSNFWKHNFLNSDYNVYDEGTQG